MNKRKIVFHPTSNLTREDTLVICRAELIQYRRTLSEQKLMDIIHQWDFDRYGKITQRMVFKNHPISKKTTDKYWYLVKELVEEMNGEKMSLNETKQIIQGELTTEYFKRDYQGVNENYLWCSIFRMQ